MRLTIFLVLLLAATATIALPVAAQDNESAEPDNERIDVDGNVYIEDWEYSDGTYRISVNASSPATVYALPPIDASEEDAQQGDSDRVDLDGESSRQLSVDADGEVVVMTPEFLETMDYARLSKGSDALVGPPYGPDDLWIVGGATAVGVATMTVWRVLSHLTGRARKPERVA